MMSTSQGTYVPIEQTSEAIRVTYQICRAGGGARTGIENRWSSTCYSVHARLIYYMNASSSILLTSVSQAS